MTDEMELMLLFHGQIIDELKLGLNLNSANLGNNYKINIFEVVIENCSNRY
jgi:hypothetical protein